ncbi:heme-binding protein 2 isoform X1 [Prionailurus iriomotensis]
MHIILKAQDCPYLPSRQDHPFQPTPSFDGFSSAQKNQEQLLTLASMLREEGKVFNEKVYYTAGYNSPFKLLDRNNEVWLIQKNEPCKETE